MHCLHMEDVGILKENHMLVLRLSDIESLLWRIFDAWAFNWAMGICWGHSSNKNNYWLLIVERTDCGELHIFSKPLLKLELMIIYASLGKLRIIASHKSKENGFLFVETYLKLQAVSSRHKFNCFNIIFLEEIYGPWKVKLEAWNPMLLMFYFLKNLNELICT